MNRRNFFKVVTGFVAGIFATSVEGKKFSTEDFGGWNPKDGWSAGIDPNSEWAKQKPLTLDMLIKAKEELESVMKPTIGERLGCKDCFVGCEHFDECLAELEKRVAIYDAKSNEGRIFRTYSTRLIDPTREYFKVAAKELPPLLQRNIDDTIINVFV